MQDGNTDPNTPSTNSAEETAGTFFPIHLAALVDGSVPKFSLYIQSDPNKPPVLYREKDLAFDRGVKERLLEQNIESMFIPGADVDGYYAYMEDHLGSFLDNNEVVPEAKAQMLYGTAVHVVKDLLANPESEDLPVRAYNIVTNSVDFICTQKSSIEYFLKAGNFDYQTYTHSVQVMLYSIYLAGELGYDDPSFFRKLSLATFLHDIGKGRIPDSVLHKKGPLNDEEWVMMKKHPEWGCEILSKHGIDNEMVIQIVRSHHEKLDGSGYPDGLTEDEIPTIVKIVTICDIFDALTTRRSYKDAMGTFRALKIFQEEMESQIDKKISTIFIKMLASADTEAVS